MNRSTFATLLMVLAMGSGLEAAGNPRDDVKQTVLRFYAAYNAHDFSKVDEATSRDWNHINPLGGRTKGRAAVVRELEQVHSTFLKGVSDTPENIDVDILSPNTAMATVLSRTSSYTTPDGVPHINEETIRTFVLVREKKHWKIIRDHNTFVRCNPESCRS